MGLYKELLIEVTNKYKSFEKQIYDKFGTGILDIKIDIKPNEDIITVKYDPIKGKDMINWLEKNKSRLGFQEIANNFLGIVILKFNK